MECVDLAKHSQVYHCKVNSSLALMQRRGYLLRWCEEPQITGELMYVNGIQPQLPQGLLTFQEKKQYFSKAEDALEMRMFCTSSSSSVCTDLSIIVTLAVFS
jgi:hypothetical protein